jgi:hypothetical protein
LGENDPDKENHGNLDQILPDKKWKNTKPNNYARQRPSFESTCVSS